MLPGERAGNTAVIKHMFNRHTVPLSKVALSIATLCTVPLDMVGLHTVILQPISLDIVAKDLDTWVVQVRNLGRAFPVSPVLRHGTLRGTMPFRSLRSWGMV